jgi:hypothetical protein
MNKKHCPLEEKIIKGLSEDTMSEELQEHIAGCSICQDIALVQGWMNRFQTSAWKTDVPGKVLPDAESLWNRAHTRTRLDKKLVRKALRPLIIPQVLFYGLLVAGIIYTFVWGFSKIGNFLDNRVVSTILPFFGIMMTVVLISFAFCAFIAALDRRKHPV